MSDQIEFDAYFKSFNTGNKEGDLLLTLGVPIESKYDAFPITDLQGVMVKVTVVRRVRNG
jgi:hypothetical protein